MPYQTFSSQARATLSTGQRTTQITSTSRCAKGQVSAEFRLLVLFGKEQCPSVIDYVQSAAMRIATLTKVVLHDDKSRNCLIWPGRKDFTLQLEDCKKDTVRQVLGRDVHLAFKNHGLLLKQIPSKTNYARCTGGAVKTVSQPMNGNEVNFGAKLRSASKRVLLFGFMC